jgi:hypothetical protein
MVRYGARRKVENIQLAVSDQNGNCICIGLTGLFFQYG